MQLLSTTQRDLQKCEAATLLTSCDSMNILPASNYLYLVNFLDKLFSIGEYGDGPSSCW